MVDIADLKSPDRTGRAGSSPVLGNPGFSRDFFLHGRKAMSSTSVRINNLFNNKNIAQIAQGGPFAIFEHQNDMSVSPGESLFAYFMKEMNVRKRQVFCDLENGAVRVQAGAMQWTAGDIQQESGVKGVGSLLGKLVGGAVTGESAIKPVYRGTGYIMLEPTYNFLLLENVASWGSGIVLNDGLFLACEDSVAEKVISRKNISSAVLGGEGLFNLCHSGNGYAVLESPVPREELLEFEISNDVVKIDGNMAIAWSSSLEFTVEKSGKSLLGSAIGGEGLVNVYRGSGKILMAPTLPGTVHKNSNGPEKTAATSSQGIGSTISTLFGS